MSESEAIDGRLRVGSQSLKVAPPHPLLELDLFGFNLWGLGAYLDPEGWEALNLLKRVQTNSYGSRCPRTSELASTLYKSVGETSRWGHQLAHGAWVTFTDGLPKGRFLVRERSTAENPYFVEPIADSLKLPDVLKHLHGRRCALGTTDSPFLTVRQMAERDFLCGSVGSIRIDVDQDTAWLFERREEILDELRDQKRIVEATGLTYQVFKTGGRGVQIVIPLGCRLEPVVASFLSRGIRMALRSRRNLDGVHVDRDGFDTILRLPGGVHARGNTGLFIDVDCGQLLPLDRQVELIRGCLGGGPTSGASGGQLLEAQEDLTKRARNSTGASFAICDEAMVIEILRAAPENPLSQMVKAAFQAAGTNWSSYAYLSSSRRRDLTGTNRSIGLLGREWAEGTWNMQVQPGGWWDWINMGGDMGMLCATILFGRERAEEQLLDKANRHPAASRTDQRERESTTRSLWKSFTLKDFRPYVQMMRVPDLNVAAVEPDVLAFAEQTTNLVKSKAAKGKAINGPHLTAVLAVILQAIVNSDSGNPKLSLREIEALVRTYIPSQTVSHVTIGKLLRYVTTYDDGVDWDTVLGSPQRTNPKSPVVRALTQIEACYGRGEKPTFLAGEVTREWVEAKRCKKERQM